VGETPTSILSPSPAPAAAAAARLLLLLPPMLFLLCCTAVVCYMAHLHDMVIWLMINAAGCGVPTFPSGGALVYVGNAKCAAKYQKTVVENHI
jgi:hypothetical protein